MTARSRAAPEPLVVARGTCYALFAFEVAQAIDLAAAERRVAAATQRQTVKQRRRAPAYFEYSPAPLRVTQDAEPIPVGAYRTTGAVEIVLYDFGAVSVSFAIPIEGPFGDVPGLSDELWGNDRLAQAARGHVERLVRALGDAAPRQKIADFVEDYTVVHVEAFAAPYEAFHLWTEHAQTVAQILRAAPHALSQQEVLDATASRLSFGPSDAVFIDTDAALVFDPEGEDVRDVIEFANSQLLEMRYLDRQLDDALERAYDMLSRHRWGGFAGVAGPGPDLRRLGRMQLDAALLFEQVVNALKLIGEQYLTRVYGLVSRRFHLADWDTTITRKLQTIDGIYGKIADRAATRRMELLEWIIIILIALSIGLPLLSPLFGE